MRILKQGNVIIVVVYKSTLILSNFPKNIFSSLDLKKAKFIYGTLIYLAIQIIYFSCG